MWKTYEKMMCTYCESVFFKMKQFNFQQQKIVRCGKFCDKVQQNMFIVVNPVFSGGLNLKR